VARQPEGPPPPPTVQKLRLRYAKRGPLRFASHRDLARALERALRRAGVPMAFSAGFSPHPKISYVGAAPTGAASEAEYLEIGLAEARDPEAVRAALDASLPPGVDVLECVEAAEGSGSLADRIDAARWRVELPGVARGDRRQAHQERPAGHRRAGTRGLRCGGRHSRLCHTDHGRPAGDARRSTRRRVGRSCCRRRPAPAVAPSGRA
jgi:hypothetical protein